MFNPSKDDVRRFFCDAWSRHQRGQPLTPLETIAIDWVLEHPEYHPDLEDVDRALAADYPPHAGRENPFLHLSLHLAVTEQISIDQPPGIRRAYESLARRHGSLHAAAHDLIDCLAEAVWQSQRSGQPLSNDAYLGCVRAKAGLPPA
ncbi:MAG TPA: DUF1841 family protein [Burkholderiaceae bacterium]|jgi:hypothetical protein|nr:DUF1841 family protein [Burkholderiaceae bacterium]